MRVVRRGRGRGRCRGQEEEEIWMEMKRDWRGIDKKDKQVESQRTGKRDRNTS